jgi:D-arabinan exo alpha-(1,3)/(1,5)-arabinofuranosidase (non-reducing end)
MKTTWLFLGVGLAGLWPVSSAETQLSYVDLIQRLTDLEQLATLPVQGERCQQWSSYDRASRYNQATGKYEHWDANGDGGGFIRREGNQFVIAEMQGPGCIWRIWSAQPEQGRVRIYLDGDSEAAVDLPFRGYFDRQHAPFTRPALVNTVSRGWNNYTPIPYQKSCRIIAEKGWGAYYQFVYSTFPEGTRVPTFKMTLSSEENAALDEANRLLSHCGPSLPSSPGEKVETRDLAAAGGGSGVVGLTGPRAIKTIRLQMDPPIAAEDRTTMREWTIQIRWDGEEAPSVWAPLGDFFGTAAGPNPYRSWSSGLTEDGWWYSHWYMPFARAAEIKLVNDGAQHRAVHLALVTVPLPSQATRLARFHAKWHRDAFLPTEPERQIDWTLLKTEGRGRFCGVMLHIWNPRGSWWGEGDEKFFVDGEKFPSTIGTGSEDYFGYAWSDPALFQDAYHNQTISMGNKGHICVNRWQVTDNIPFQKSFAGFIEKYFPNRRPTLYAATAYWYLAPGGRDPYPPVALAERVGYWTELQSFRVKDAMEGESLKILGKTGGNPHPQDLSHYAGQWSHDAHLWWTDSKPGDRLDVALPVQKSGKYKLIVAMTKARDYGIAQLYLDGKELGGPIDFFDDEVVPTGPMPLGEHELAAGEHRLTVEIKGANPRALKAYMTGLDYVKLEPMP